MKEEAPIQSVTTTPTSSLDDQGKRMKRYLTAMGFRVLCGGLAIVTEGWVRWTLVAAAIVLPYVAVVLANAVGPTDSEDITAVDRRAIGYEPTRAITHDDAHPVVPGRVSDE